MSAACSPGPWVALTDFPTTARVEDAKGCPVALLGSRLMHKSQIDADAHLIAAARELRDSLSALLAWCAGGDIPADLESAGRAALAKARS